MSQAIGQRAIRQFAEPKYDPILRRLSKEIRLLAAIVNSAIAGRPEMVESARLSERRYGDGWNAQIKDELKRLRQWRSEEDIWVEAGIPERRRLAHKMDWEGRTDKQIADHFKVSIRTVEDWLYNDRKRLAELNAGELDEILKHRTKRHVVRGY